MKTFKVPSNIVPKNPSTAEDLKKPDGSLFSVSFRDFCEAAILTDPRWVKSFADVRAASRVSDQLAKDEISLDDADYQKLRAVAEEPANGFQGYHPSVVRQLYPFLEAILEAK